MITEKQWQTIHSAFLIDGKLNKLSLALRDLFALGCVLHANSQHGAGIKAITAAWEATPLLNKKYDTLLNKLLKNLPGNEKIYRNNIHPHSEFMVHE